MCELSYRAAKVQITACMIEAARNSFYGTLFSWDDAPKEDQNKALVAACTSLLMRSDDEVLTCAARRLSSAELASSRNAGAVPENDNNLEEKIAAKITTGMMKAGFDAYYYYSLDCSEVEDRVKGIYIAMETVRRKSIAIVAD